MSIRQNRYRPDVVSNPGDSILELAKRNGLTQRALAEKLGVKDSYLSDIIRGKRGISVSMSLKLESIGWVSAEYWLGLQIAYDLAVARSKR